jgi:hypothetical protein
MALTLRPTGMSSPASKEQVDFVIHDEDGEAVGRIYKNGGIGTPPDVQWSWSITARHYHQRQSCHARGSESAIPAELATGQGASPRRRNKQRHDADPRR